MSDVTGCGGTENSIGECMCHRIGVGMTGQPTRVRDGNPTQDQGASRHESVGIVADTYPGHAATVAGWSIML